ncbi:hypothetical protein GC170_22330 [bacterium]|nr:hypothetical protein [bacterium]
MFRRIRSEDADLDDITIMGEVVAAPGAVVRRFGKPSPGEGYKISGEITFTNDAGEAFVLHDWLATNLYHPEGPTPESFWASEEPAGLSVSSLDLDISIFSEWLAEQLDSNEAVNTEKVSARIGDERMKTIEITPYIHCRVPEAWRSEKSAKGILLRTPDGGSVSITAQEFRKPAIPEMGPGITSAQLVSAQVAEFGQVPRNLTPHRATASHAVHNGTQGNLVECRGWHLVNQVGPWHHETVMFTYEPPPGRMMEGSIVSALDAEVPRCTFAREYSETGESTISKIEPPRPWWRFW